MEPIHINIDDFVGYGNASFNTVKEQIRAAKGRKVRAVVNGYGGYVTDAVGIYNLLRGHDGETETHMPAWGFSADTIIFMGGKKRTMAENGFFMIHNAQGITIGDRLDHSHTGGTLGMMDKEIIDIYHRETGLGKKRLQEMMNEERIFSAKEALDLGFVHELTPGAQILNSFDPRKIFNAQQHPPTIEKNQNMKMSFLNAIRSFFNTEADADEAALEAEIKKHGSLENFTNAIREDVKKELTAELDSTKSGLAETERHLTAAQKQVAGHEAEITNLKSIITDKDKEIADLKNEGSGEHAGGKTVPPAPPKNERVNPITAKAAAQLGNSTGLPFD